MSDDIVILGSAPRPTDGPAVAEALRGALRQALPPHASGIENAGITVETDGDDISSIDVNLTGVALQNLDDLNTQSITTSADVASTTPSVVRHASVEASPLLVAGAKVEVSGSVDNLPATWVETTDGRYGLQFPEPNDAANPVTGGGQLSITKADINLLAKTVGAEMAKNFGVELADVNVDVTQRSSQQAAAVVDAKIKKGFISASAQVSALATLDSEMGVTISEVAVGSRNPVINAVLGAMKGKLERFNNRRFTINDKLPAGVRLSSADFSITDTVTLRGAIG